ncbi:MAG: hypothetical protein LKE40_06190 [Spirochaetia bacterium]|jgi:hypothetical protein|nr:hypothetical protein [Spirochaetia bacterium]
MKKTTLLTLAGASLLVCAPLFADGMDMSGFSDFSDDATTAISSDSTDSSDSFGSFFGGTSSSSDSSSSVQITGKAKLQSRAYLQDNDTAGSDALDTGVLPSLKLNLNYSGANSDLSGTILLDPTTLETYPEDIINEFSYRAYLGKFVFEAGKTKIVWGRGDKLHVLDLFNANDYTDFVIPDYIDRRIAEPEIDMTWNSGNTHDISIQAVWTPGMTPDRYPTSGRWEPSQISDIYSTIETYAATQAATASATAYGNTYAEAYQTFYETTYQAAIEAGATTTEATVAATAKVESIATASAIIAAAQADETYGSESYYLADTDSLKYSQYGLRVTGTTNNIDWGTEYYLGHYKTPSLSIDATTSEPSLDYDRLQVFGADAETVKGPYTLRGELGYYLTDDIDGDDPSVHNNSIQWLAGFDRDLPWNEMNINVQTIGSFILNYDDVKDNTSDVDYNSAKACTNDKIAVQFSDSFMHENLKPSVTVMWGIRERRSVGNAKGRIRRQRWLLCDCKRRIYCKWG